MILRLRDTHSLSGSRRQIALPCSLECYRLCIGCFWFTSNGQLWRIGSLRPKKCVHFKACRSMLT